MKLSFRNMFQAVFGKTQQQAQSDNTPYTAFQMLNGWDEIFTPVNMGDMEPEYDDATVRTCIHTIANHAGKLKPAHIRRVDGKVQKPDNSPINDLLYSRPNEFMSTYDFIYKVVSQLQTYNNSFVYIKTDNNERVVGLYPLDYTTVQLVRLENDPSNEVYCKFMFMQGYVTVPYTDIIHLRKHYNRQEFFGERATMPMRFLIGLLKTCLNGLERAILNSQKLRGVLKFTTSMRPEDLSAAMEKFEAKFLNVRGSSGSGIAGIDTKAEFQQLTSTVKATDTTDLEFVRKSLYNFYGLNEAIISGDYSETQWQAFYQSTLEPIAIQMSQEFTAKLFTEREKGYGNEVVFETNRLSYSSVENRTALLAQLLPQGIITINEAREMFGFEPVEGGDERQISLNFVNTKNQSKYQVGKDDVPTSNESDGEVNDDNGSQ